MNVPVSRKRGRPVDPDLHARRRQQILEVAVRLFGQQGYTATDTQQLADALGVGKGTIYRYFRNKRELFYAALRQVLAQLDEEIESAVARATDPFQISIHATTAYLRFFLSRPHAVQLLLQELAFFRQEGAPVYFRYRRETMQRWVDHLNRLMAAGAMRPMRAETVVEIMGDSLFGIMLANFLNNRQRPPEMQARQVLALFFRGLLTDTGQAQFQTAGLPPTEPRHTLPSLVTPLPTHHSPVE